MKRILYFFLAVAYLPAVAQGITGKVVDAQNGESIPFANINVNAGENLISNAEGYFSIPDGKYEDASMLTISYMGFKPVGLTISELKTRATVKLEPGVYELKTVDVEKPDANKIITEVRKNLSKNYKGGPSKNTLFMREYNQFRPKIFDFEITKSTGFTKKGLESANKQLQSFTSNLIAHPTKTYSDVLCNYYSGTTGTKENPGIPSKLDVVKAVRLLDESRSASVEELDQIAAKIMLQHLDTLKYYRIKSGLIGTRDTVSLRKDYISNKKKKKKSELESMKGRLLQFYSNNDFLRSKNLDFINNHEIYEYSYGGATFLNDDFVYILDFKPRKSRAIYTGKLYVTESDFAVVRADYGLAKGKKVSGVNLKWLLGIKVLENVSKGTLIFRKKTAAQDYYLQYASVESGQYLYINRPLKFIELTDEERDVVAMEFKIEGTSVDKTEFLTIASDDVTAADVQNTGEKDFTYQKIKKYDPSIWKDYSAIEPLEEMKAFRVAQ